MHFDIIKKKIICKRGNQFVYMALLFLGPNIRPPKKACNAYIFIDYDINLYKHIKQCPDTTNKRRVYALIKARGTCFVVVFFFHFYSYFWEV